MNSKTWMPLAVAIVLGLGAAFFARSSMKRTSSAATVAKTVSVVVAKGGIAPGQELTANDLALTPIAGEAPAANGFTDTARVVGRVAMAPMVAGQPVLENFLAAQGTGSGLQALVPHGMRAITIDITESTGLAGLVTPGCRVDVVTTAVNQEKADRSISRSIVQSAWVLAVGQRTTAAHADGDKDASQPTHTVTLLVTPHDAEAIDVANNSSRLRLTLRGSGDTENPEDKGVMLAELRGDAPPTTAPSVAPVIATIPVAEVSTPAPTTRPSAPDESSNRVVTIILGTEEQRVTFKQENAKPADVRIDEGDAFFH